ncbi:class I SAM-dependent methyltransferase [Gemmata sp. G18]|uniref:Class I SAM-dependent methyltransferase n=1 Tax=Gemmata palustris TaxID=2822762 RepID=A0ABS5C2V1_9BACT|nr:class I SAM-dependent methyltransferase [Gemmata palustris]MBP3959810.1 class I SAM-dependent methyltransferase [Gemmata palustris]
MMGSGSSQATVDANAAWFADNDQYIENQSKLECYQHTQRAVEREVRGADALLDIGNGGFFNFDTALAGHVTAVDLFLKDGPGPTANSTFKSGSFLDLPFPDGSFDCVMQQNVLHHVTGHSIRENFANMRRCVQEMFRVCAPGGKAVVVESTVGSVFNLFERVVHGPLSWVKRRGHPVTFQYTAKQLLTAATASGFELEEFSLIPRGRWILQFGVVWPTLLTPATPIKLVLRRPRAAQAVRLAA